MRRGRAPRRHGKLKHYFVPGVHNAYRPHFLRAKTVVALGAIIVMLFFIAVAMERLVVRSPSPQVGAVVAAVLVDLANSDRLASGLLQLSTSTVLERAAQMKADDMAARGYFAHASPEGRTPWHWFQQAGYRFRFAGENLAVYFSDSVEVERAWMESTSHRANILSDEFTEIGIALARGEYQGKDTVYVVQMFGQPAASASVVTAAQSQNAGSRGVAGASAEALEFETIVENDTYIAVKASNSEPRVAAAERDSSKPIGALAGPLPNSNAFWRLVTAPKTLLQYIYIGIGAFITLALLLLVVVEFRPPTPRLRRAGRHKFVPIAYGVGLLALLVALLYGGTAFFSGNLLIL